MSLSSKCVTVDADEMYYGDGDFTQEQCVEECKKLAKTFGDGFKMIAFAFGQAARMNEDMNAHASATILDNIGLIFQETADKFQERFGNAEEKDFSDEWDDE